MRGLPEIALMALLLNVKQIQPGESGGPLNMFVFYQKAENPLTENLQQKITENALWFTSCVFVSEFLRWWGLLPANTLDFKALLFRIYCTDTCFWESTHTRMHVQGGSQGPAGELGGWWARTSLTPKVVHTGSCFTSGDTGALPAAPPADVRALLPSTPKHCFFNPFYTVW